VSATRVFVSFDVARDRDLFDRLVADARAAELGIELSGGSETFAWTEAWRERTRRGIRGADCILVICSEQTDDCVGAASELRIAQEEQKPYVLLWGRRELMCTKPTGARPADGMYTWTLPTLQEQLDLMRRTQERKQRDAARHAAARLSAPDAPRPSAS
jgi:hypothetical protein